jgi:hypothetical protein
MKITPVSPIPPLNNSVSSPYFSQNHTNNRRHKMSNNNNTDTNNTHENSEDNTVIIPMEMEFTANLNVPQEIIDEGERALNRFKWTILGLVGAYIALVIVGNILLSS